MIDFTNSSIITENEKPISSFVDYTNPNFTNITLQNEVSLNDISDGFEAENRRYNHLLEL